MPVKRPSLAPIVLAGAEARPTKIFLFLGRAAPTRIRPRRRNHVDSRA